MPKVTLTDIEAGYQLKEAYNANNDRLETAIENTLSRDGTAPNSMAADLDMNSNKVTNVANGTASGDAVNFSQLQALQVGVDHGLQSGLADDDHPQYHNDARGDARYSLLAHNHAGVYEPVFSKNTAFNKNFGTLVDTVCQGNDARLSDARTPTAHTHIAAEITDLAAYTGFDARYFTESEVTSLLSGKADTVHTHVKADITDFAHTHPYTEVVSVPTNRLLGRTTAATGAAEAVSVGSGLQLSAGSLQVNNVPWSSLTGTPTTLSGYGITDAVNNWGAQTIAGQKTFEASSGNTLLTVQKSIGTSQAVIDFRDEAGVQRNIFGLAGVAGDDFFLGRYNDAGVWQGSTMYVPAATGIADFQYTPTAGGVALALSNAVVNLTAAQTVAGVKTFSSAPRTHRAAADMKEWWRTDATANQGRWVWQVGATGTMSLVGLNDAGAAGQTAMDISRSGSNVLAVNQYANGLVTLATQQYNTGDATTGAVVRHRNGGFYDVGMNVNPVTNIDGADLTLSSSHVGGLIRKWDTTARNLNIPASTDVDIPIGAWFEYHGWNPGVVTLVGGAGVTINWLTGAGITTGNRSFAQGSAVKIWRVDAARWHVSGVGIS